jgi:hypothetical protein
MPLTQEKFDELHNRLTVVALEGIANYNSKRSYQYPEKVFGHWWRFFYLQPAMGEPGTIEVFASTRKAGPIGDNPIVKITVPGYALTTRAGAYVLNPKRTDAPGVRQDLTNNWSRLIKAGELRKLLFAWLEANAPEKVKIKKSKTMAKTKTKTKAKAPRKKTAKSGDKYAVMRREKGIGDDAIVSTHRTKDAAEGQRNKLYNKQPSAEIGEVKFYVTDVSGREGTAEIIEVQGRKTLRVIPATGKKAAADPKAGDDFAVNQSGRDDMMRIRMMLDRDDGISVTIAKNPSTKQLDLAKITLRRPKAGANMVGDSVRSLFLDSAGRSSASRSVEVQGDAKVVQAALKQIESNLQAAWNADNAAKKVTKKATKKKTAKKKTAKKKAAKRVASTKAKGTAPVFCNEYEALPVFKTWREISSEHALPMDKYKPSAANPYPVAVLPGRSLVSRRSELKLDGDRLAAEPRLYVFGAYNKAAGNFPFRAQGRTVNVKPSQMDQWVVWTYPPYPEQSDKLSFKSENAWSNVPSLVAASLQVSEDEWPEARYRMNGKDVYGVKIPNANDDFIRCFRGDAGTAIIDNETENLALSKVIANITKLKPRTPRRPEDLQSADTKLIRKYQRALSATHTGTPSERRAARGKVNAATAEMLKILIDRDWSPTLTGMHKHEVAALFQKKYAKGPRWPVSSYRAAMTDELAAEAKPAARKVAKAKPAPRKTKAKSKSKDTQAAVASSILKRQKTMTAAALKTLNFWSLKMLQDMDHSMERAAEVVRLASVNKTLGKRFERLREGGFVDAGPKRLTPLGKAVVAAWSKTALGSAAKRLDVGETTECGLALNSLTRREPGALNTVAPSTKGKDYERLNVAFFKQCKLVEGTAKGGLKLTKEGRMLVKAVQQEKGYGSLKDVNAWLRTYKKFLIETYNQDAKFVDRKLAKGSSKTYGQSLRKAVKMVSDDVARGLKKSGIEASALPKARTALVINRGRIVAEVDRPSKRVRVDGVRATAKDSQGKKYESVTIGIEDICRSLGSQRRKERRTEGMNDKATRDYIMRLAKQGKK